MPSNPLPGPAHFLLQLHALKHRPHCWCVPFQAWGEDQRVQKQLQFTFTHANVSVRLIGSSQLLTISQSYINYKDNLTPTYELSQIFALKLKSDFFTSPHADLDCLPALSRKQSFSLLKFYKNPRMPVCQEVHSS